MVKYSIYFSIVLSPFLIEKISMKTVIIFDNFFFENGSQRLKHLHYLFITKMQDWETFYDDEFKQTEQLYYVGNEIEHRSFTSGNIYIKNSLFESLKASTNGGGICCESVPNFLAEDTQFVNCSTLESGGAIHFNESNIVLHKVCGFDCKTQSSGADKDGPFANIYVSKNAEAKNYIIESQISHCTNTDYGFTVSMHYGNITFQYANESRNNCSQCTVFRLQSSDADGSASYSSFCDNTVLDKWGFLVIGSSSFSLSNCNIISNYANKELFDNEATKFTIRKSCILNNECSNTYFYRKGESEYEIIECILDCGEETTQDYIKTDSMHTSNTFIVALNLLNTGNCYGTYDIIGTLTPIIPTPQETPNPTKNLNIGAA